MPPAHLLPVLIQAWVSPFTTRSDFARQHTDLIAEAGCCGLITTRSHTLEWGRTWRITASGLAALEAQANAPLQGELL